MTVPPGSARPALPARWPVLLVLTGLVLTGCRSGQVGAAAGPTSTAPAGRLPTGSASTGTGPTTSPAPSPAPSPSRVSPSSLPTDPAQPPEHPSYTFPVRAKTVSYGRAHHDYPATDIFAACGSAVVAPVKGQIVGVSRTDRWSPSRNDGATRGGLSVTILGLDGVRYYGSHLRSLATATVVGHKVMAGTKLGAVGNTGDARSVGCHLHFGISVACPGDDWWNRRGMLSPYPFLKSWSAGENRSPVVAVRKLKAARGCPGAPGGIDP